MNDEPLDEWLERAEEDYHQAQVALRQRKHPAYHSACFHAQQCAEKYIKAFLVRNGIQFRKVHDLTELQRLCIEADSTFNMVTDLIEVVYPYAVAVRYPGFKVTETNARDAVAAMKQIRKFVRARLGLKTR
ncbi:MAG: HEPN domain-containing protein [Chloroflexi bacterium]|nr:HEPN domain-containing protein [Chloroflexota bacterium]